MDINRLDLNLLLTLDTLLTERNVTRAAKRLSISQPALSARLTRLRELLGDALLLPAQRGMTPTQRAIELQGPLHDALESVRRVVAQGAHFAPADARATVSIAATDYTQLAVLVPFAKALRKASPGLRIAWRTLDASALASWMERGEVDLALMTTHTAPQSLHRRKLYEERYVVIARKNHPKVRGRIGLATFCELDHVVVSPEGGGFSGPTDEALEAIGRARKVAVSAPAFLIVPELVARSEMIALVPERIARGRALQILEPPLAIPGFTMAMAWHDRTATHPMHRWLRERVSRTEAAHGINRSARKRSNSAKNASSVGW